MSGSRRRNRTTKTKDEVGIDQVEELLKATEDELLLNLTVGSHMSKVAPSYIDSDLNRRFQALKSKKPSTSASSAPSFSTKSLPKLTKSTTTDKSKIEEEEEEEDDDDDDHLLARFAALKGSRHAGASISAGLGLGVEDEAVGGDTDEEDEVDKIISWAKDAARLDPSPPTDSDDSDNFKPSKEDDEEDSESEDELVVQQQQQKKSGKKQIGVKKPFFFC